MSDDQVLVLWGMVLVGWLGTIVGAYTEDSKKVRIAAGVWVVFWWLPPLTMLWIKGVFG